MIANFISFYESLTFNLKILIIFNRDILKKNGTAVDAAITTLLCMSLVLPHSLGLGKFDFISIFEYNLIKKKHFFYLCSGGGSFMTYYDK